MSSDFMYLYVLAMRAQRRTNRADEKALKSLVEVGGDTVNFI